MPLPFVQSPAPSFTGFALLPTKEFSEVSMDDYKGKWVVFFWYPLDFTYVCPTEIIAFGDRIEEFDAMNTAVLAASCDSLWSHLAWVNMPRSEGGLGPMKIPILADFDKKIAIKYGVMLPDGVPLRALFLIDPLGVVRHITVNDINVGRNVDEILRLIKAHQFVEEFGEVCPANWQPGERTMKPDPLLSKTFFQKANNSSNSNGSSKEPAQTTVADITDRSHFAAIIASKDLTVVDYWAPWCKNCKKISPTITQLAGEYPHIKFVKINTVEAEDISIENGVDALPTIQFFQEGKMIGEFKGSDTSGVEKVIRCFVKKTASP